MLTPLFLLLFLVLSPATAQIIDFKWDVQSQHHQSSEVAPGKFVELCGELKAGEQLDWQFHSAAPLNFNIHSHEGKAVITPVKKDAAQSEQGILVVDKANDYCLMWTNTSKTEVKLTWQIKKSKYQALTPVFTVEGITEYRLDNGLTVLLFPDPSKPITTVNITYKVGSRHENYGETGMAHLLEHLLFKGTPSIPHVGKMMAERGVRNNATTWIDRTNYFGSFPVDPANLAWLLAMEAERMTLSTFDQAGLDQEMTVVRNEMESGENQPWQVLYKRVSGLAFDWHNNGKDTIGNRSDVENVEMANLRGFYARYYQPDNAVLLIAGDFKSSEALALVQKYFGPLAKPKRVLPREWTLEPAQDGERTVNIRRVSTTKAMLLGYKVPGANHPDTAPLAILADYLGDKVVGRLQKDLVEKNLASEVFSDVVGTYFSPGMLYFGAQLGLATKVEDSEATLLDSIEKLKPISDKDTSALVRARLRDLEQASFQTDKLAVALSEAIAAGDWRLYFYGRDQLAKVTATEVMRVAQKYLRANNRTLGRFLPAEQSERVEIPKSASTDELNKLLSGYQGKTDYIEGEAFDVAPAMMHTRTQSRKLANGADLSVLRKRTRGGLVHLTVQLRYGNARSLSGSLGARTMIHDMMLRGSAGQDKQVIKERFDALSAVAMLNAGGGSLTVKKTELNEPVRYLLSLARSVEFPAKEFELLRSEKLAALEAQKTEPDGLVDDVLVAHYRHLPPEDPRFEPTITELMQAIKNVTREEVVALYQQLSASHAVVAVVGDVDLKDMQTLFEQALGDWRSSTAYERIASVHREVSGLSKHIPAPDKDNAVLSGRLPFALRDDHPDYPALLIANDLLGGAEPSRLWQRIREKEGLSYDVRSGLSVDNQDEVASWNLSAIAAPENMTKVTASMREEIALILDKGFTSEEVEKAKSAWQLGRNLRRSSNDVLVANLINLASVKKDLLSLATLDQAIAKLSSTEVHRAFKKYFKLENLTLVTAGSPQAVK